MPDLLSLGLGGGSEVAADGGTVGPRSVGYRLTREARCFGGRILTATDFAVAAGRAMLGDRARVENLPQALVDRVLARVDTMITEVVDRMKTDAGGVVLLAVGGGSFLIPDRLPGTSDVRRVEHHAVANAVGAAIAQASGEVDRIFSNLTRDAAIEAARREAETRAVEAGAAVVGLRIVEVEDMPLSHLPLGDSHISLQ
jgi:N-methylhydantoinase A/oxoprolinase/acetone carboxylase beta subunit